MEPIWHGNAPPLPTSFNVGLPEIYQIEATSACNYECPMCYRFFGDRQNENSYFRVDMLRQMLYRGDLEGSHFIELQLSGEPLLHPHLRHLIDILHEGQVLAGLSTNGSLLHPKVGKMAERNLEAVCKLDAMTISVDGVDDETYELYRPVVATKRSGTSGPSFSFTAGELFEVIDLVLKQPTHPILDLQIIELPGWQEQMDKLVALAKAKGWMDKVNLRTTPDSFILMRGEGDQEEYNLTDPGLCLNPWLSVTVLSNGDVTSCCYDFHSDNRYGNLNEATLAEIWEGKAVQSMRRSQTTAVSTKLRPVLPKLCQQCYLISPVNIHRKFFDNFAKGTGRIYLAPGREVEQAEMRRKGE